MKATRKQITAINNIATSIGDEVDTKHLTIKEADETIKGLLKRAKEFQLEAMSVPLDIMQ